MKPKNNTPGQTRYLTLRLYFPKDKDVWCQQMMFAQPLDNFIAGLSLKPEVKRDLCQKGEASWFGPSGERFRMTIDEQAFENTWGRKTKDIANARIYLN